MKKYIKKLKKLLNDPRTGLKDSSDTNKTYYSILELFDKVIDQSIQEGYGRGRLRCLQHHYPKELEWARERGQKEAEEKARNMRYTSKKKYNIELTEAQILWLERFLGLGTDGYFERNLRERKHCDNIHSKLYKELELRK